MVEHIAIMREPFLSRILAGVKTIETRWSSTRRAPWGRVAKGETIWFKRSSGPVVGKATVRLVEEFTPLTPARVEQLIQRHATEIGVEGEERSLLLKVKDKRYAVLVHLEDVRAVSSFAINKKGFGNQMAWMCVESIAHVKHEPAQQK